MQKQREIAIISNREHITINVSTILYVIMKGRNSEIHVTGGGCYQTREALDDIFEQLGDGFIRAHRSCIVAARAVHRVKKTIELSNGEVLEIPPRKRREMNERLAEQRRLIVDGFCKKGIPSSFKEYSRHYGGFESLPFAFADLEITYSEKSGVSDWIVRYGNPAFETLMKAPAEKLVGSSFGSLFSNPDSKWLRSFERAALYGEKMELIDYRSEVGAYLKVICYPTFEGHCGCLLFNVSEIEFTRNSTDAEKALLMYLEVAPTIKG